MSCRVEIATESERREQEWRRLRLNLKDWRILGTYDSKSAAQTRGNQETRKPGSEDAIPARAEMALSSTRGARTASNIERLPILQNR